MASGIAHRAGIDPLIVRGIFVVLALFGGPGILLYILGWLFLPDMFGRIHVEDIVRGRASTGLVVAAVIVGTLILVPTIIGFVSGTWIGVWDVWDVFRVPSWFTVLFNVLWVIAVVGGIVWFIVWLVSRNSNGKPHDGGAGPATGAGGFDGPYGPGNPGGYRGPGGPAGYGGPYGPGAPSGPAHTAGFAGPAGSGGPGEPGAPGAAAGAPGHTRPTFEDRIDDFAHRVGQGAENAGKRMDEWGESMGEWGEQRAREAEAWERSVEGRRSLSAGYVVLTIALALLAAGGMVLWYHYAGYASGRPGANESRYVFIAGSLAALVVLSLAMIVAGVRGKRSGWVGFLAFLGVVALFFSAVVPFGMRFTAHNNNVVVGSSSTAANSLLAGDLHLDLSDLDSMDNPSDREFWLMAGQAFVDMPDDTPVVVMVTVNAGEIVVNRTDGTVTSTGGMFVQQTFTANLEDSSYDDAVRVSVNVMAGQAHVTGADPVSSVGIGHGGGAESVTSADAADPAVTVRDQNFKLEASR